MADMRNLLPLFSLLLMYVSEVVESTSFFTAEDCAKVGFSTSLQCSSCNELDRFNLLPLKDDCLQCCHAGNESQESNQLLPHAELIVCS